MLQITNHKIVTAADFPLKHDSADITPKYIVAHNTAGISVSGSLDTLKKKGFSYHIIIDRNGSLTQSVPFNKKAYHAGNSNWKGLYQINSNSIGISMANRGYDYLNSLNASQIYNGRHFNGSVPQQNWEEYPLVQVQTFKDVCLALLNRYPSIIDIICHDEISMGRKVDPGPAFPLSTMYPLFPQRTQDLGPIYLVNSRDNILSVRKGMEPTGSPVMVLNNGDRVHIRSIQYKNESAYGDWVSISLEGTMDHIGFVNRTYLKAI